MLYHVWNIIYINILHKKCNVVHFFHTSVKVSCCTFTICWTLYTLFSLQLKPTMVLSSSTSKFLCYFLTVPSCIDKNVLGGSLFPSFASPSALNPSDVVFSSIVYSSKIWHSFGWNASWIIWTYVMRGTYDFGFVFNQSKCSEVWNVRSPFCL